MLAAGMPVVLMKLDWKMTVDSELHDVELPVQFQGEA
jgi:hypothetical protein